MKQKNAIRCKRKPKVTKWIILAFQHVFAMFGATVLVPLLVNSAAGTEVYQQELHYLHQDLEHYYIYFVQKVNHLYI